MLFIIAQISINLLHSIIKIIFHYKERIEKKNSEREKEREKEGKIVGRKNLQCNVEHYFCFISFLYFHFVCKKGDWKS